MHPQAKETGQVYQKSCLALSGRTYVEWRQPVDVYRPDRTLHFDEGLPVDGALNAVDVLDLGGNQESRGASARGDGGERRLDVWG